MSDYTDIQQELDDLENAVYGEEVRDSMVSAIKKIHDVAESAAGAPDATTATAGQAPIADGEGGWAWGRPTAVNVPVSGFYNNETEELVFENVSGTELFGIDVSALDGGGGGGSIAVDSALSDTSRNPVQNKAIKSALNAVSPSPDLSWILNRNVDGSGSISTNNYMAVTYPVPAEAGDMVIRKTQNTVDGKALIGYVSEFDGDSFLARSSFDSMDDVYVVSNSNTTNIRIAFGRTSGSGVQVSQNDVDTYFKADIYRKAVPFVKYDSEAFVNRGSISSLGYTSLSQCDKQGFYTFGSSDSLSDLPAGWSGGGLVTVYKNGSVMWQRITGNYYRFVRYGTSGEWHNEADLVCVKHISETGENQSTEKLNIYIPRDINNRRTMYQMGHCVDASSNADVWRIMFAYRVDTNGTLRKLTMTGEWECALKLGGRSDFSGGVVHGDEVDTGVSAFVDGTPVAINSINAFCHVFKIVKKSNLYDPNDGTTIIAEHGVEYIYTAEGLKINQSIIWKESAILSNCYLAMLPVIKAYSTYRYDDTSFDIVENSQSNYSVTIPNAKSVTEYSDTYDCIFTMSVPRYPTGMTGGDCALITDNNGLNYNKVYFPVCTSGTVNAGDMWQSTTVISNNGNQCTVVTGAGAGLMSATDKSNLDTLYADYLSASTALG